MNECTEMMAYISAAVITYTGGQWLLAMGVDLLVAVYQ